MKKNKTSYKTDIHLMLSDAELTELICIRRWYLSERYLDLSLQEVMRYIIHKVATNLEWKNPNVDTMN